MSRKNFDVLRYTRVEPYTSISDLAVLDLRDVEPRNVSSLSKGVLPKWDISLNNEPWMVKLSSRDSQGRFRTDSITEAIVFELSSLLGFCVAEYELVNVRYIDSSDGDTETVGCVTKWFLSDTSQFISDRTFRRMKSSDFLDTFTFYQDNYPDVSFSFGQMIILDFLIQNHDRHAENFGVVFSRGSEVSPSPIFDNGAGLFGTDSNGTESDNIHSYYGKSFKSGRNGTKDSFIYIQDKMEHYLPRSIVFSPDLLTSMLSVIDKYSVFLSGVRTSAIKTLFEERLNYVRSIYS